MSRKRIKVDRPQKQSKVENGLCLANINLYASIAPQYCLDLVAGVQSQHLDQFIMTYSSAVQGIVLSYSNLKMLSSGIISAESPFSYAWVSTDLLVWKPKVGQVMAGWVNLQSPSHIGLLVCNVFNASIKLDGIPSNWKFKPGQADDESEGFWVDLNGTQVEGKIKFLITGVHLSGKVISLEGSLTEISDDISVLSVTK
ncbi:hypothetical protein CANCADRAFT_32368 [Tortispora caseinolytica NRRL Y-17796]|uniref:DNA-directed RNA polymerase subunit n=1 Tax=Tortispora caseinolytica NRRL Y-17796 TaxID=767744 RepID=A0A1E4TB45_9ASCO|nr:hypothetical protein CANCADRAFT_32368 [Tortispora caseinolytica NRRL Y-17796]